MATEKKVVADEPVEGVPAGSARPNDLPLVVPAPLPQHLRNSTFAQRAKARSANKKVDAADGEAKSR